jgi:enamine deaminase RidA (YjgF/YER057c/UK114 family)
LVDFHPVESGLLLLQRVSHDEIMHAWKNLMKRDLTTGAVLAVFAAGLVLTRTGNAVTPTPAPHSTADDRRHIVLPSRTDTLPYSDGVLVGDTLFLAGRIGIDPETGKPPAELEKEIRFLLDGMKTTLAAANMTMDDLVSVQVFCPDLTLYEKFNEIYRTYFIKDFPARAFIGSGPLLRGGRFEAQGIAVRR